MGRLDITRSFTASCLCVQKPDRDEWGTGLDAMQVALGLEKSVNQALLDLHAVADSHKDAQVCNTASTLAWAVSQHTDMNKNTKALLKCCCALHSYMGTIFETFSSPNPHFFDGKKPVYGPHLWELEESNTVVITLLLCVCLLYTSDAADER